MLLLLLALAIPTPHLATLISPAALLLAADYGCKPALRAAHFLVCPPHTQDLFTVVHTGGGAAMAFLARRTFALFDTVLKPSLALPLTTIPHFSAHHSPPSNFVPHPGTSLYYKT
jgi:hypothetical protein